MLFFCKFDGTCILFYLCAWIKAFSFLFILKLISSKLDSFELVLGILFFLQYHSSKDTFLFLQSNRILFFMKLGACMSTLYTYLKFMLYKSYLSHAMLSRILTPIPKSFFSLQYYGSTKGLRDQEWGYNNPSAFKEVITKKGPTLGCTNLLQIRVKLFNREAIKAAILPENI